MDRQLIPRIILKKEAENCLSGSFEKVVLFIDIAGFSPLSEKLMENGTAGAEALSEIINKTLGNCVKLVHKYDGFVANFAGDAFWALFSPSQIEAALSAAKHISDLFVRNKLLKTPFGNFDLSFRGGFSIGKIDWKIIDNEFKKKYYFHGKPIDNSFKCHQIARIGEIVLDESFIDHTEISNPVKRIKEKFYSLQIGKIKSIEPGKMKLPKQLDQQHFVSKNVLELKEIGEFRSIVSCFITLKINKDLDKNISLLLDNCQEFGAYFKDVIILGKLAHILVYFGTPSALENVFQKAADFALKSRKTLKQNIKIGMSFGMVFSGFIDTEYRSEFLAIGKKVNLASRLNSIAKWAEILIDNDFRKFSEKRYDCPFHSKQRLKGFSEPIDIFQLKSVSVPEIEKHELVGREKEIEILTSAIKKIDEGKFGGIINIVGEAGIGKSFLVDEFHSQRSLKHKWQKLSCNEMIKRPMNTFEYFIKNYFEIEDAQSNSQKLRNFNEKITKLISKCSEKKYQDELIRTKSLLAYFLGIHKKNSLYEKLNAQDRKKNIEIAFKTLFKILVIQEPLIIHVDDVQWIDQYSKQLLSAIVEELQDFPVLFIFTGRYLEDRTIFDLDKEYSFQQNVIINQLSKEAVFHMLKDRLKGDFSKELENIILKRSHGNPFYIEQMVQFLQEKQLIYFAEKWELNNDALEEKLEIPQSINSIILARIDRLNYKLKTLIKTASVLGREFAVDLLSEIINKMEINSKARGDINDHLNPLLLEGERKEIWSSLSELIYLFKHSLIRQSVYNMQLKKKLRSLHELAAVSIEEIYSNQLENFFEDLAYHYEKAENIKKTAFYLQKAADKEKSNYQNENAIKLYKKLLNLSKSKIPGLNEIDVLIKMGNIQSLIGKTELAYQNYKKALHLSEEVDDKYDKIKAQIQLGIYHKNKGNFERAIEFFQNILTEYKNLKYDENYIITLHNLGTCNYSVDNYKKSSKYIDEAMKLAKKMKNNKLLSQITGDYGVLLKKTGNYKEAVKYLKLNIEFSEKFGDDRSVAYAYNNMGNIQMNKGEYEDAEKSYKKAFRLAVKIGDKLAQCMTTGNLGIIYMNFGRLRKSLNHYKKSLDLSYEIDDKIGIAITNGNMAIVLKHMGKFDEAFACVQKRIEINKELGDKSGTAFAYGNLGNIQVDIGKYDDAIKSYTKMMEISQEIGYQIGITLAKANLASAYTKKEDYNSALKYLDDAINLESELDLKDHLAQDLNNKAQILLYKGNLDEAEALNKQACEIAKKVKADKISFDAEVLTDEIKFRTSKTSSARKKIISLTQSRLNNTKDDFKKAFLHSKLGVFYEILNEIELSNQNRKKSMNIYKKLYKKNPNHDFFIEIEKLKDILAKGN